MLFETAIPLMESFAEQKKNKNVNFNYKERDFRLDKRMKKIMMMSIMFLTLCASTGFSGNTTEKIDMAGKIGFGIRSTTFDVRYFVKDWLGVHAGTRLYFSDPKEGSNSTACSFMAGSFYSTEIVKNLLFQTGLTFTYDTGENSGIHYNEYYYSPYVGAEYIYKGRFGLDFKVIPITYFIRKSSNSEKGWASGYGSVGAHIYF